MKSPKIWVESVHNKSAIAEKIRKAGFRIDRKNPDFVLTYGGDGAILAAEWKYPGVPKIPVRKSMICSKCDYYDVADLGTVLRKLKKGSFRISATPKVEAIFRKKSVIGLNEVQVRNKDPRRALRFLLNVDGKSMQFIADGIVAATPYGSTAYYKSLGYEPFGSGIRIGLNNPAGLRRYFVVKKTAKIRISRERALLAADNQSRIHGLKEGDTVLVRESKQRARFVRFL
ncbi:MAG: NAD(+)/NADH kinase [Candidatus Aenigmarchaeota archaeon]|nr:NAD(+)/NADH kinase [Candidatus Aenigmarchaeota archaeon]